MQIPTRAFTQRGVGEKQFPREEVEAAFRKYWHATIRDDWDAWVACFSEDASYCDHFWGPLQGRREIDIWMHAVAHGVPEVYTVLDWYVIDNDLVVFHVQNRRDNPNYGAPGETGPAYWDFAGFSVLRYAGDGLFSSEEDFWDSAGARKTSIAYAAAAERAGAATPESRILRRHWPASPDWARTDEPPRPSWLGKQLVPAISKPAELRALLGRP